MGNICRKVLNYVMEHSEVSHLKIIPLKFPAFSIFFIPSRSTFQDSRNTLKLYLKFFDLLDGYKKTLLNEIGDFLKDAVFSINSWAYLPDYSRLRTKQKVE